MVSDRKLYAVAVVVILIQIMTLVIVFVNIKSRASAIYDNVEELLSLDTSRNSSIYIEKIVFLRNGRRMVQYEIGTKEQAPDVNIRRQIEKEF